MYISTSMNIKVLISDDYSLLSIRTERDEVREYEVSI